MGSVRLGRVKVLREREVEEHSNKHPEDPTAFPSRPPPRTTRRAAGTAVTQVIAAATARSSRRAAGFVKSLVRRPVAEGVVRAKGGKEGTEPNKLWSDGCWINFRKSFPLEFVSFVFLKFLGFPFTLCTRVTRLRPSPRRTSCRAKW